MTHSDAATGRQIWKRATNGPVRASATGDLRRKSNGDVLHASPAIADGVYVRKLGYAFNAQTGALKWKFATDGERRFEAKGLHGMQPKDQTIADPFDIFLSSPVVANGVVYFGSGDGNLYALDSATGDLRWKFKTGDVVHASPALADGVLFFGSWDSYFYRRGRLRQEKRNGVSTEAKTPMIHNREAGRRRNHSRRHYSEAEGRVRVNVQLVNAGTVYTFGQKNMIVN